MSEENVLVDTLEIVTPERLILHIDGNLATELELVRLRGQECHMNIGENIMKVIVMDVRREAADNKLRVEVQPLK